MCGQELGCQEREGEMQMSRLEREEGLLGRRARLKGKAKYVRIKTSGSAEGTRRKWVVCVGEEKQKKEGRTGGGRSEGGEVGAPK